MATDNSKKSNPFDPEALMKAQQRNFEAFASAGQIFADGMRTYAERQVAMVQEAMGNLWSELQASGGKPHAAAAPNEQIDRMREAFEKVMTQVQELGNLLLKVQREAVAVLNDCAAKNLEAFASAPELAALQQKAKEAFEAANQQTAAAMEEMKKRMTTLERETQKIPEATSAARSETAAAAKDEAPASTSRTTRKTGGAKSSST